MNIGIPPLLNSINNAVDTGGLLVADALILRTMLGSDSQWGIMEKGVRAIRPDSFIAIEFKHEWRIADYPMEQGAFQSYNKVQTPFDIRVTLSKSGLESDISAFLQTLEDISNSLILYDIVTPQRTYLSASIHHYDYRRTAENGVQLIVANMWFLEVRNTVRPAFSNTTSSSATASQSTITAPEPFSTPLPPFIGSGG